MRLLLIPVSVFLSLYLIGPLSIPVQAEGFDRAQILLINLNRGPGSSGQHLLQSIKQARQTQKDLDKALRQLEQVEKTYSKSRKKLDEHFLSGPAERIKQAQKTAEQLEDELSAAYGDLKETIRHTLLMEQE